MDVKRRNRPRKKCEDRNSGLWAGADGDAIHIENYLEPGISKLIAKTNEAQSAPCSSMDDGGADSPLDHVKASEVDGASKYRMALLSTNRSAKQMACI